MSNYLATARASLARSEISEISEKSPGGHPNTDLVSHSSLISQGAKQRSEPPADPRPDRANDALLWRIALGTAFHLDGVDPCGVFGALLGMRCLGGRLIPHGAGLRMEGSEEFGPKEYERLRAELMPHASAIAAIFAQVARGLADG